MNVRVLMMVRGHVQHLKPGQGVSAQSRHSFGVLPFRGKALGVGQFPSGRSCCPGPSRPGPGPRAGGPQRQPFPFEGMLVRVLPVVVGEGRVQSHLRRYSGG